MRDLRRTAAAKSLTPAAFFDQAAFDLVSQKVEMACQTGIPWSLAKQRKYPRNE
jgi:hypothetical protein